MTESSTPDISEENFASRMLYKTIRSRFPKVMQLSTDMLSEWLSDEVLKPNILLVDVREKEEHVISSIKNSIKVTPNDGTGEIISKIQNSTVQIKKVIVFCSLGYRSCSLVKTLYKNLKSIDTNNNIDMYNLEGGLFKWANENKEIVDNDGIETTYVHPYNAVWEKFLEFEKRYSSNF